MPLEYGKEGGLFKWVKNPFSGCTTYFNEIHKKTLAVMSRGGAMHAMRIEPEPGRAPSPEVRMEMEEAVGRCVFCPGNEDRTPEEVMRLSWSEVFDHGPPPHGADPESWAMRVVNNLIPRVPEECTGGSNESYVVLEDSRHFHPHATRMDHLIYSGALTPSHFHRLMELDVEVMRRAYSNPRVSSVIIRKNQGAESGASQPHVHNQVLGADQVFPDILKELRVTESEPDIWEESVEVIREIGLIIEEDEDLVSYWSPYGKFPRSFDVVMPGERVCLTELNGEKLLKFSGALHRLLAYHGPIPLDYEIHSAPGIPVHAHINSRLFTYSNIGGTINVPSDVSEKVAPIREALLSLKADYPLSVS
jgi:galactose-1-phosphate uridylyltransferase